MWFLNFFETYLKQTQEPPIFYGKVMHKKGTHTSENKRKRTKKEQRRLLNLAGILAGVCLLSLLLGVLGCIYTLYVHDQIFDWVVYTAIALAVLSLLSALVSLVFAFLKKKK